MLLHAILLLLGSLAVAESARPCATSLIEGVTTKEVDFDVHDPAAQLRVTCSSDLFYIKIGNNNIYDSLTCDASRGWMAHRNNVFRTNVNTTRVIAEASSTVNISCVDLTHCDTSRVNGLKDDKNVFSSIGYTDTGAVALMAECAPQSKNRMGILVKDDKQRFGTDREQRYGSMACTEDGWSVYSRQGRIGAAHRAFGKSIPAHIQFSCFEYCAVIWQTGLSHEARDWFKRIYKCSDSSQTLFLNGAPVGGNEITCSMWDGWGTHATRETERDNTPFKAQNLECRSGPTQGGKRSVRAMRIAEGKQEE